jgi:hypothetical protein
LYRTTAEQTDNAAPEWLASDNAERFRRVYMEYHPDFVMMQLRLEWLGEDVDGSDIRISYFGQGALNFPADTSAYLSVGDNTFTRFNDPSIYYPTEIYDHLPNPLMGSALDQNTSGHQRVSYIYLDWRQFEPNQGEYNFTSGSVFNRVRHLYNRGDALNLRFHMDYPQSADGANAYSLNIPDWLFIELNNWRDENNEPFRLNGNPDSFLADNSFADGTDAHRLGGIAATPAGNFYNETGVGSGFAPNYAHPQLILRHKEAIEALAEEIARPGSPWGAVYNMQLGSLGHWENFTTGPASARDPSRPCPFPINTLCIMCMHSMTAE